MQPLTRFSLETHAGPYTQWPPSSRLGVDGQLTHSRVPGYVIEAQYQCRYGVLLLTSFDCPFEESSAFTLLDAALRPIARAKLATPYHSHLLHAHWPIDALTLGLHYADSRFYTLAVVAPVWWYPRPRLRLRRCPAWRDDARMRAEYARLQAALRDVDAVLDAAD